MKKILFTATVLLSMTALTKAQQGRVGINTTTPAATLDVVANTTDATRPDALLVPRLTRSQLATKNAAYTVAQNGALTFVNTLDGTAAGKTINVTATGFYYYDAANTVWVAVGVGGGAATPQRYEATRGTSTVVTTTSYIVTANDYLIETEATSLVTVTLPAANTNAGRVIVVSNQNTANSTVIVIDAGGTAIAGTSSILQFRGKHFISDGTRWVSISYN